MTRGQRWHFLQGAKVDKIPLPSLASHAPAFPVCLSDIRLGVLDGGPLNAGSFGPNAGLCPVSNMRASRGTSLEL